MVDELNNCIQFGAPTAEVLQLWDNVAEPVIEVSGDEGWLTDGDGNVQGVVL